MSSSNSYDDETPVRRRSISMEKIGGVVGSLVVIALLLGTISFFSFTTRVEAGQACTITHFGKAIGEAGPGLHTRTPFRDKYNCLNSRKQVYELVEDPKHTDSKANFTDFPVSFLTFEGISFAQYATVQYHVPVANVRQVFDTNARSDEAVKEQIVKFHTRSVIPQILNTYTAEQLYLGDLAPISKQIGDELRVRFAASGVVLDYFELKRGDPDDAYQVKVDEKAAKTEAIKAKVQDQELAKQEAERQRVETEGNKAAAIIDAEAAAAQVKIDAQAKADAVEIAADAEAYAVDVRGKALTANPSVLEWEKIGALRDADVIYLPSDTILPLINLSSGAQAPDNASNGDQPTK